MTQNHVHIQTTTKNWPWDLSKLPPPPPSYPIENIQEGFLPVFYFTMEKRGYGGANFLTSDDLQIFFCALYHEMVCASPELKGSDDV